MADTIKEMMSAYVAGCMDMRNLAQFVKFLEQGDYIPLDELGELQNIASLIPILLEREAPPASLQNQIFSQIPDKLVEEEPKRVKRKVNLGEIIKEELAEEKQKPEEEDVEIEIPEKVSFTSLERDTVVAEVAEKLEEEIFATKKSSPREEKNKAIIEEEKESAVEETPHPHVKIKSATPSEKEEKVIVIPPEDDKTADKKVEYEEEVFPDVMQTDSQKSLRMWQIIAGVAGAIALIFIIMYFSLKSTYNDELTELQKIVKADKIEIEDEREFINSNLPLIEIFGLNDVVLVDLASTSEGGKTEARIIVSPGARRGVLQFLNTPKLAENESLQLWVVNKGQSYSVGVFHPTEKQKFYTLGKIPFIPFDEIEMFRITKEPKSGSEFPSGKTYLFGAIRIK